MHHDTEWIVRSELLGRIEDLQAACAHLPLVTACERLDAIRGYARRYDFEAVERLASLLESVIACNGHRQVALTYLALMREAAQGEAAGCESARVYLAAAALRGCR